MEWLVAEIGRILVDNSKDSFKGLWGKIKIFSIKKKLKKKLFYDVLNKYENRLFYNELDNFLSSTEVISNVIINCESTPIHQYKSKSQVVYYYVQLFFERYPNHTRYRSEIYTILQSIFEVIYNTLNDQNLDENARVICNIAKELAGELSIELKEIKAELFDINNKIDIILKLSKSEVDDVNIISLEQYFEYLARLYPKIKNSSFVSRNLYYKYEEEKDVDALDALLKNRHILLLGEAGYGKTYESIDLLSKICTIPKASGLLPFFLPLYEYGMIYSSIMEGINYKIKPFCDGDPEKVIRQWLANEQVVLILDGIDDIQTTKARNKFIAEVRNFASQYDQCYLFITSRLNICQDELHNIKKYYLRGLSRAIISRQLRDKNIYIDIPDSYFQLFENPMLFNVGKKVLKQNHHRQLFNRSILFEELMIMLCGEWNKKKGISNIQLLSYSDMIGLLGHYAFDTFYQPSSRLLEFEQFVSKFIAIEKKPLLINALIESGILKVTDRIGFVHKLFKEYCTAYHMVNTYPLSENRSIYLDLINRDDWKEVFVFASGMYNSIEYQDSYLDFIMNNNLQLYIECINAKSDLSAQLPSPINKSFALRYLSQIVKTYTFIIDKYFQPLKSCFEPETGKIEDDITEEKIRIVGNISHNGESLNYWFERVMPNEVDVICINEDQIAEYYKSHELKAIIEKKKIVSHGVSLKNSGLVGDSGRKIAIDLIEKNIKSILKQKMLIESRYLLCERLDNCKEKIKEIKDLSDIKQMSIIVENMIQKVVAGKTDIVGYSNNGIDMFYLRSLLKIIINNNIDYNDSILPKENKRPNESSYRIWDLYTDTQKANRISKFFYFHQLSYLEMVKANFPVLYQKFTRYLDAPYQNVILIDLKDDREQKDIFSEPILTYYYVSSHTKDPVLPELRYLSCQDSSRNKRKDFKNKIYDEIIQSYLKQGREVHRLEFGQALFTFITTSMNFSLNNPLSDYVYDSIKHSLEEIFGNL